MHACVALNCLPGAGNPRESISNASRAKPVQVTTKAISSSELAVVQSKIPVVDEVEINRVRQRTIKSHSCRR
ncbi:unnamed protein product [Chondrus crispus]|uniref:Uncharacterized protein n=1 Tax=Chondrus crispus TaxID=2769 RepID=R7Q5G5_CHOCR|nr:unnamed protein product [Chondrus crispus]CDF33264.1 unnamed protein product [Chondrus crispus]|eukprot:XP_005713067.1 unnamed protein product [Chondrus crispus]